MREAARTGHMTIMGNAGLLPLARIVVVLVCGARTKMASGSSQSGNPHEEKLLSRFSALVEPRSKHYQIAAL